MNDGEAKRMGAQRTKRDDFQIMADLLRLDTASKTGLLLSANLRQPQLERYLGELTQGGFLEHVDGPRFGQYRITPRGRALLEGIDQVTTALGLEQAPV